MNYESKWLRLFPNDERVKLTDQYVGFPKKDENGFHMGGCYLYAYDPTGELLKRSPNHLDESIIYIGTAGSSTSRGICSRTADFLGTILKGHIQKNPYENGLYFRALFGEANKKHLFVAYMPMGYGSEIKLKAHKKETEMIEEYKEVYGKLPSVDGHLGSDIMINEHLKMLNRDQLKKHLENVQNMLNSYEGGL
jgi:hypothetical protein